MWSDALSTSTARSLPAQPLTPSGAEFEHYYFTLEAAIGGLGVAVAPWHLVIDDIRAGRLIAPLGFCDSGYQYVAQHRPQTRGRLDYFCKWLTEQARDTPRPTVPPKT
jgi:LysR family transcriptional regulator, glycine cleavage system transcriptional activator